MPPKTAAARESTSEGNTRRGFGSWLKRQLHTEPNVTVTVNGELRHLNSAINEASELFLPIFLTTLAAGFDYWMGYSAVGYVPLWKQLAGLVGMVVLVRWMLDHSHKLNPFRSAHFWTRPEPEVHLAVDELRTGPYYRALINRAAILALLLGVAVTVAANWRVIPLAQRVLVDPPTHPELHPILRHLLWLFPAVVWYGAIVAILMWVRARYLRRRLLESPISLGPARSPATD